MGSFFTALFAKVAAVVAWIGKLWVAIFVAAWDLIRDAFCWPFEQLLDVVDTSLTGVDVSGIASGFGAWGSLPAEVTNVLGLLGVGTAISIISAAIVIRLGLQLIPFVRLGS